jgi:hypothetical protein
MGDRNENPSVSKKELKNSSPMHYSGCSAKSYLQ